MRDLNEINLNQGGSSVNRKKPNKKDIKALGNMIGTSLPKTYIDFLMFSNGGCPELDTFDITISGVKQNWSINCFFYLLTSEESTESIFYNYNKYSKFISKNILPIANDGGGNIIGIDIRNNEIGKVLLWIHDSPSSDLIFIANSFEEFIDMLYLNPDYI